MFPQLQKVCAKCWVVSAFVQPWEVVEWTLWRHNVECSNFQPDIPTNSVISHLNAQKNWLQWFLISSAWMGGQNNDHFHTFLDSFYNVCTIQTLLIDFNASIPNTTLTKCRFAFLFSLCCNKLFTQMSSSINEIF